VTNKRWRYGLSSSPVPSSPKGLSSTSRLWMVRTALLVPLLFQWRLRSGSVASRDGKMMGQDEGGSDWYDTITGFARDLTSGRSSLGLGMARMLWTIW
jgi:hypothetical protein